MHARSFLVVLMVAALVPVAALDAAVAPNAVQEAMGCDPLDAALCLLPFPNDKFTVADPTTATGRRINFSPTAMPRNGTDLSAGELGGEGKPMDPTEWNRNDGFSPGQAVLTYVPGLDLHRTWGTQDRAHSEVGPNQPGYFDYRDHIAAIARYKRADAPMVIINAETGERHPFWSELDSHAGATDARRVLMLRPARNYDEATRYIVALRNMRDASGAIIQPGAAFKAYRDGTANDDRAPHMNSIFRKLRRAGIDRSSLYLAWDFTVASERSLSERILSIRDDAFGRILGDTDLADRHVEGKAPTFEIVGTPTERDDTWTDSRGVQHTQRVRRITGRIEVPNYLDRPQHTESLAQGNPTADPPVPLSRFYYGKPVATGNELPMQNPAIPTVKVPFLCDVPLGEGPSFGTLYGHGLLGTRTQIGDVKWPRRFGFAGCGMDWWGMSTGDLPSVATILTDLGHFASLPDRAQQGFLNFMYLGRAMVHPKGLVSSTAFQQDGKPLLVTDTGKGTKLYYDGNSQGGIMGGSLVAVSPDIRRGILGVTGMNYSTLLNRSVDWEGAYGEAYYATIQDPIERQLGMQLIQMLWDRGEANGYAHHTTEDPLANTPKHDVMLQISYSDHQVSVHAAEVNAATVNAPVMRGLPKGRHWAVRRFNAPISYPYKGSALIYWDSGNATPPNGNIPADNGDDPHGAPRSEPAAGWQEVHFLRTGWMVDVCNGGDYLTSRHPSNAGTPSCQEPVTAP
jgi:hypothetical protein